MNKYIFFFLFLFVLGFIDGRAQDPQFSQFYASPLYLGPSMAGTGQDSRFILNYRDQWPKLAGRYITYALSFDHYIPKYKSGIGILALYDDAGKGKLATTQIGLNYSYRIKVSRDFLIQPGLQFQYYQRRIDFNALTFADQYFGNDILPSSIETPPGEQKGHIDFSSSLLAFGKKYWFGFTFDHLMKMNKGLTDDNRYVPVKTSVYGGYKFILRERLLRNLEQSLSVAFHYRKQAQVQQLDMGLYYHQFPFSVGIWYRGLPVIQSVQSDALAISCGAEIQQFIITYSYDLTVSSLVNSTGGAHEIGLIYSFEWGGRNKHRKMETVPCPKF
jgi:type IX secretion system PorP/SprF family membrane protein